MGQFIARRLLMIIPVLLVIYTLTFFLFKITPGSPFQTGSKPVSPQVMQQLEKKYGLDRPWWNQYSDYIWDALHGDLGPSYVQRGQTVREIIGGSFPVSLQLAMVAIVLSTVVGISLGVLAGLHRNSLLDHLSMGVALLGISVPEYVSISLLIVVFGVHFGVLPSGGWDGIFSTRIIIPAVALALAPTAVLARYTRSSVLEVLGQDYVRTARAKGLRERVIVYRHVLKNALIPVVTVGGVQFAFMMTGSFFVESIANVPGLGRAGVRALMGRDYPVIMGIVLFFSIIIVFANLLVDVLYAFLDPRMRATERT